VGREVGEWTGYLEGRLTPASRATCSGDVTHGMVLFVVDSLAEHDLAGWPRGSARAGQDEPEGWLSRNLRYEWAISCAGHRLIFLPSTIPVPRCSILASFNLAEVLVDTVFELSDRKVRFLTTGISIALVSCSTVSILCSLEQPPRFAYLHLCLGG
jgi:hypothetical protein